MSPIAVSSPFNWDISPELSTHQIDSSETANAVVQQKKATITTPLPNPSLQVTADHNLKQVEAPVYAPGVGEVLLHIKATGVCGSVSGSYNLANKKINYVKIRYSLLETRKNRLLGGRGRLHTGT